MNIQDHSSSCLHLSFIRTGLGVKCLDCSLSFVSIRSYIWEIRYLANQVLRSNCLIPLVKESYDAFCSAR
jgi:hypothetical protein